MNNKLAVFDLDGTLINTLADLVVACNFALEKEGLPVHEAEKYKKQFIGNGLETLVRRAIPKEFKSNNQVFNNVFHNFFTYYSEHIRDLSVPYDGIYELLSNLKKYGFKLAILSNKQNDHVQELKRIFFEKDIDLAFGERVNIKAKPDPMALTEIMEYFNTTAQNCYFIGDTEVDIDTAKNANVTGIAVTWGFRTKTELENAGSPYIVNKPQELYKLLVDISQ